MRSNVFLRIERVVDACITPFASWPCIALQQGSAHISNSKKIQKDLILTELKLGRKINFRFNLFSLTIFKFSDEISPAKQFGHRWSNETRSSQRRSIHIYSVS